MEARGGRPNGRSAALRDLTWILLAVLALVVFGSVTRLFGTLYRLFSRPLQGQVADALAALILLSLGLALFGLLRARAGRREIDDREPPLRQRKEDIPLLVEHFVTAYAKKFGKSISSVSSRTMNSLEAHSWPGNVRELANVIERAVIHSQGSALQVVDRFETVASDVPQQTLEEVERDYIIRTLESTGWRIEGKYGAAGILGLNPSTLRTRMLKLGIQRRSSSLVASSNQST